jgi:hypothetical protein
VKLKTAGSIGLSAIIGVEVIIYHDYLQLADIVVGRQVGVKMDI